MYLLCTNPTEDIVIMEELYGALLHPNSTFLSIIQNWRAVAALVVSVPPNLPGLINAINPAIDIGGAIYPYNIAWLLGVSRIYGLLHPRLIRRNSLHLPRVSTLSPLSSGLLMEQSFHTPSMTKRMEFLKRIRTKIVLAKRRGITPLLSKFRIS